MAVAQGVSEVSVLSDGYGGEMDGVEALARQDDNAFEEDILAASDSDVIDPPNLGQSDREAIAAVEVRSHQHRELGESGREEDSPQTHADTIKKLIAAKVADGKRRMKVLTDDHSKRRREAATKHEAKAAMELAESKQE